MADHLDSVKSLEALYRTWASNSLAKGDVDVAASYSNRGDALKAAITELEELRRVTKPIPASYGDLSDLPPELLKELSGIKVDDLEQQIYTIIKSGGDEVELDAVLIELFRRYNIIQTRKFLQNKLWRMAQKGVIWSLPGRKGVYSAIQPPTEKTEAAMSPAFDSDLDDDVPF